MGKEVDSSWDKEIEMMDKSYHLENKKFVLSISYGNYQKFVGGTDKVIIAQKNALKKEGVSYVYLYPRVSRFYHFWEIIIDDEFLGIIDTNSFLQLIIKFIEEDQCILQGMYIHHLLKANLNDIRLIFNKIQMSIILYIHDYYMICENYFLLKNGKQYCGAGKVCSEKCKVNGTCSSFQKAIPRSKEIEQFLKYYKERITCIAPSAFAGNLFQSTYSFLSNQIQIVPHLILHGEFQKEESDIQNDRPVRIAYLGQQISMKGWEVYKQFVERTQDSQEYEYHYFGTGKEAMSGVHYHEVSFQKKGSNAMVDALRKHQIDAVFLYSIWPETYSFTYYESMAANCYVITNKNSGNIADQVLKNRNGTVYENDTEIMNDSIKEKIGIWKKSGNLGPEWMEENNKNLFTDKNVAVVMQEYVIKPKRLVQVAINILQISIDIKRRLFRMKRKLRG
ncbi:MAG: hypothetical protein PHY47_15455 [Lachnospiraceae bacterium]|nr:hypothetical protein [Lachnospiraceae bacterium]